MIRSSRRVEAPELGAMLSNRALVHTRFRLHAVHNARVVSEDALFVRAYARAGRVERPIATVLLEGRARITAHGERVWLEPGDLALVDEKGAIQMRQEGERYAALAFEWDEGWLGARPVGVSKVALPAPAIDCARDVWERVGDDAGAAHVAHLVRALAAEGAPLTPRPEAELEEVAPERMASVAAALDEALSKLADQPMTADLERTLGLSTRQIHRLVAEYNERYGFNSAGWIDTRNRRRLMMGATLMTAPNATARYVAAVVGYKSAAAFARALADAGFPPPSAIAERVAELA